MSLVQRFNLRADFYEKLLTKPECLQNLDIFLHPLFNKEPKKAVNPNLFLELQRVRLLEAEWEEGATESFDAEAWEAEQKKAAGGKAGAVRSKLDCYSEVYY